MKLRAGEEAERQMAFYLHREFGKDKECFLINDLRISHLDETAQIDHLIVSQYGLFIIESKSAHGEVIVNEHSEWSRTFNNKIVGMSSPALQAQAQGRVIKELLVANKKNLLGKMLFGKIQKGFGSCPVFVYVAISDSGLIRRKSDVPELFKADQVAKEIAGKLSELKKRDSVFNSKIWEEMPWAMKVEEAQIVAEFLLSMHRTLSHTATTVSTDLKLGTGTIPAEKSDKGFVPKVGAICPECGEQKLSRKSVARSDGTETDYLACEGYPSTCKAIFALVAIATLPKKQTAEPAIAIITPNHREGGICPRCKKGTLVIRKGKTKFLGCSSYPKCKFTDYRDKN